MPCVLMIVNLLIQNFH
uniref:Uncharacterized protein n=1 Tax=Rhizophora mucronata TaxID=61149 RepID=A0A2P2NJA9_RHIMU